MDVLYSQSGRRQAVAIGVAVEVGSDVDTGVGVARVAGVTVPQAATNSARRVATADLMLT